MTTKEPLQIYNFFIRTNKTNRIFQVCSQESCTFAPMELATNNNGKPIVTEETDFVEDIKQIVNNGLRHAYQGVKIPTCISTILSLFQGLRDLALASAKSDDQLFASKYLTFMPTEEQLRHEIEQQKELFLLNQQNDNQQ